MTLLDAINDYIHTAPALKIGYIGKINNALLELLDTKLAQVEGTLHTFIYGELPPHLPTMQLTPMPDTSRMFRAAAREFEYLIIHDLCSNITDVERLLKNVYKSLENSGNLIILESQSTPLSTLLESCGFVACNTIDIDDAPYRILSAKKMHGWGHGL